MSSVGHFEILSLIMYLAKFIQRKEVSTTHFLKNLHVSAQQIQTEFKMSSAIEQRVDNDLDPAIRETDMNSKRDDVPTSDGDCGIRGSGNVKTGSDIFPGKPKQYEFPYRNDASRQSKALLEQFLNEYDVQNQEEKTFLLGKVSELQDETDWYKDHFSDEIASVKDKLSCQFDDIKALMKDFIENEQEERNAAFQEIEEQLILRDNEVDGLLEVIAKQSDELKQAKLEREELKKEMKSILVTLHVQFERFDDKIFKSEAEVTLLREDLKADNEAVFGDVEKIKECMVMFQEHIYDVKHEADAHAQKTNDTIVLAQRENHDLLQKMIHEQQSIASENLEQQKNEVEKICSDVKDIISEQKKLSIFQGEVNRRFFESEEKSRLIESTVSKHQTQIDDVNKFVFDEAAIAMEDLQSKKAEILKKLNFLKDHVKNVEKDVSELSDNLKSLRMEKESDDLTLKDTFEMIENRMQKQESITTTDIDSVKQNLKSFVELLSSKLVDLRIEVNSNLISQKSVNNELVSQHALHEMTLQTIDKTIEATKQEIVEFRGQIKEHENRHENLASQIVKVQEIQEATRYEHKHNTDAFIARYDGLKQVVQQSSEAQSLANKEFKTKQADFEEKIKSSTSNVNSLERRLTHTENCLSTAVNPDLVDVMLQPYIKQNDAIRGNIKKQAEDFKALKEQIKASQVDRTALTEKIDCMNKTWESLFQHLVGQVKKETVDMDALKKENENVLKDIKQLATSWENRLVKMVDEKKDLKESASMLSFLKRNMEACNHRVSCLADEIESHREFHATLIGQKSSTDVAFKNLKEDMESVAGKSLQAQQNVMIEQMAKMLQETDLKIQNVINAYTKEFAKANQGTQEAWNAIEKLKEAITACGQTIHSEQSTTRKNLTDSQFEALGLKLKLQASKKSSVSSDNQK
jgi:hypothetical protein